MNSRRIIAAVNACALGSVTEAQLRELLDIPLIQLLFARREVLGSLDPSAPHHPVLPTVKLIIALYANLRCPAPGN